MDKLKAGLADKLDLGVILELPPHPHRVDKALMSAEEVPNPTGKMCAVESQAKQVRLPVVIQIDDVVHSTPSAARSAGSYLTAVHRDTSPLSAGSTATKPPGQRGTVGGRVAAVKNPLEGWWSRGWRGLPVAVVTVAVVIAVAMLGSEGAAAQEAASPQGGSDDPFAVCEARFAASPEDREPGRCFRQVVGRDESLRGEAIRRLERLWRDHPDNPHLPFNLALLEWSLYTRRVPDLLAEAARLFAERGAVKEELDSRVNQSRFLIYVGRLEEAVPVLDRLAARATELGETRYAVGARIETARLRLQEGEVESAWQLLHLSEVRAHVETAEPGAQVRVDWFHLAGRTAFELGRYGEARRAFRNGLEEVSVSSTETSFRQLLAAVHISSALPTEADRRQALRLLDEALGSAQRSGNRMAEAHVHRFLGKLLEGAEGERHLRRCVDLAQELGEAASLTALCQGALAVHLADSAPEEAQRRIELAREALLGEDPWSRTFVELDHMRVDWVSMPRERCLQRAFETLDLIEQLLVGRSSGREARARVRSQWLDPYHWVAGRLLEGREGESEPEPEDVDRAFRVVERMRAQALAEALRAAGTDGPDAGAQVSRGGLSEAMELSEVESSLDPDEALLSFQIGTWRNLYGEFEGGAWLLASTRGGTRVYRLPDLAVLVPDVRRLEGLDDPEQMPLLLVRLHRQLVAPALRDLPPEVRRLVIVPDGPLHRLPFALLRSREAATASLVARYELSVVPSATLWRHWRRSGSPPFRSPALVLADPALGAPTGEAAEAVAALATSARSAAERGEPSLNPLPHARAEGRAVVELLGGGELWIGAEASEAALKREPLSPGYALLHLAAHAVADPRDPDRSAVYLAPGDGEDGRLTPAEILELNLDGRLVVLAACETASGELLRGEGILSLTRYFLQAGARGVVASLWELPDEPAAELFSRLYRHLATGESLSGALAGAQRELLAEGGPARVWGGVVVFGDATLRPFPEGRISEGPARRIARSILVLGLPVALVLGALVALWVWRARRSRSEGDGITPDGP